jgi:hypothetical protein
MRFFMRFFRKPTKTLFISWSGAYACKISEALKVAIDELCASPGNSTPAIKTFLSSVDIEAGKRWREELYKALSDANIGIVVATQDMIDSQWLAHEAGALSTKSRLVILLADAPSTLLHDPLRDYQYKTLADDDLATVLRVIAKDVGANSPSDELLSRLYKDIGRIRKDNAGLFVTPDDERWKNKFERPFAISRQESSPYDLEQLLSITRQRLVLVAQNHYYMTNPNERDSGDRKFWPLVKDLLERPADIDIVAMHRDATPPPFPQTSGGSPSKIEPPDALVLWTCYMRNPEFLRHVKETWDTLEQWDARYRKLRAVSPKKCGVFRLWSAYLTPVTMSFRDPKDSGALLIISPRVANEANDSRPQFVVRSSTCPTTFAYYWGNVNNCFNNCGWRLRNPLTTTLSH